MTRPAIHYPYLDIDFILFPYEKHDSNIYDDPIVGLKAEEFFAGAHIVFHHWMRSRSITILSSFRARESSTTVEYQGTAESGWQIYAGDLDGHPQTVKLCNLTLFSPETPKEATIERCIIQRRVLDKLLNNSKALHNWLTQSLLDILCLYNRENIAIE